MDTVAPRPCRPLRAAWARCALVAALSLATALGAAEASAVARPEGTSLSAVAPAAGGTWTTVWSDEFSAPARTGLDRTAWQYDLGHCYPGCPAANWGTGEIETMTDSLDNVAHDGAGHLAITPLRDASGGWTSGRVETVRSSFTAPAGGVLRMEGRLKLPEVSGAEAAGYWPAFWSLGSTFRSGGLWPSTGEVDVMESVNATGTVYGTLHCGVAPGGPCNETTGLGGHTTCPPSGCNDGYHTYAVEFDRGATPQQLRWYVDDTLYHSVAATDVDATTWANATSHGFFLILNVAIGGGWPGAPTAATVPGRPMLVDWVRVRTRGGDGPPAPSRIRLYPSASGSLERRPGTAAATVTLASAGGSNWDGVPHDAVTFTRCGLNGSYDGKHSSTFTVWADAGTGVGAGIQARISYDWTGRGAWSRVQTYRYLALDDRDGWQRYTQAAGRQQFRGGWKDLRRGCVRLELWNAIGRSPTTVRVGAPAGDPQLAWVRVPHTTSR